MSKKGKVKKPVSKKVLAMQAQLRRRTGVRNLEKRYLIVCEDAKSARHYFEALRSYRRLTAASVKVAKASDRTQPIQVVERAVELKKNAFNEKADKDNCDNVAFDEVWCVIDGDYGHKIVDARSKAKANGISLAISTPCFEYWVLLHFEETAKLAEKCDEVIKVLKKNHLPKYDKGEFDYAVLMDRVDDAVQRAEKLRRPGVSRGDLPEVQNPCSEVYKLVKALQPSI